MSPLARRFVKTAFVFLVIGLLLGLWMLIRRELHAVWPGPYLISAHTHVMFVGFVMFMILGVAIWLFPKPATEDRFYRESIMVLVYWLLLAGTLLRFIAELIQSASDLSLLPLLIISGGTLQLLAILLYVVTMWSRIRSTTRNKRERVGRAEVGGEGEH